jgi:hypothetical protein
MKLFYLILLLPISFFSQSLAELKTFDYRMADSIALHFPKKKYKTVSAVAEILTQDLTTEHEKFRAIFRWITDNIEYNKSAQNVADADKVVRKNKAVCQGFSNLLKEMCNVVSIPCEMISGYTKTEVADINRKLKKTDHAWNCVKLYGKWYLVDVTWATSKFNVVNHKFQKEFDEYYYLTPPEKFILDHFPAPPSKQQANQILKEGTYKGNLKYYFQFLDKPVKRKVFGAWPVYYADFFHMQINSIQPNKGSFSWKQEKPLHIELQSDKPIKDAAVLINADKFVTPVDLKDSGGGKYTFDYTFLLKGKVDITVYANGLCIAEYLLKIK